FPLHLLKSQNSVTIAEFSNQDSGSSAYAMSAVAAWGNSWGMRVGSAAANSNTLDFVVAAHSSPVSKMSITTDGNVTIGTLGTGANYYVCASAAGLLSESSGACSGSSIQYKTNVEDLVLGLETLKQLRPVTYNWKDDYRPEEPGTQLGFTAEEVEQINPMFVTYKDGQIHGVKYDQMVALLTKAIQEQQKQIEELKNLSVQENEDGQIVQIDIKTELANLGLIVNENGVLEVDTLKTRQLCVGSVCVTEAEFQAVFGNGKGDSSGNGGSSGSSGGPAPDVCDATNLSLCSTQTDCEASTGYWYNDICNVEIESVEPEPEPEPEPTPESTSEPEPTPEL
ncbi:MAG: tail fiber domain-containing protein, partial [bacterium]|nr:tail fiber domain-containing protein [bacterium]